MTTQTKPMTRAAAARILGVAEDTDAATLRRAWRAAAYATHPDHGGNATAFAHAKAAWDLLRPHAPRTARRPEPVRCAPRAPRPARVRTAGEDAYRAAAGCYPQPQPSIRVTL